MFLVHLKLNSFKKEGNKYEYASFNATSTKNAKGYY